MSPTVARLRMFSLAIGWFQVLIGPNPYVEYGR